MHEPEDTRSGAGPRGLVRVPVHQSVVRKPLFAGVEFEVIASEGLFLLCFFFALGDVAAALTLGGLVLVPLHLAVAAMQRRDPNLPWYVLRLATAPQRYAAAPDLHAPVPVKPSSVR
jgi:type IV secretory pathway TrbD component